MPGWPPESGASIAESQHRRPAQDDDREKNGGTIRGRGGRTQLIARRQGTVRRIRKTSQGRGLRRTGDAG